LQHAGTLGVALLGHPLLALAVPAEPLGTLAFGADQAFLALAVEALRGSAAAVVPTRDVDLPAPRVGSGGAAPRGFGALALLAFALLALHPVATRIVALRQRVATRLAPGLASRRLGSLCLHAPCIVTGALLLSVANQLRALGRVALRLRRS